jgi:hypothetical protein
MGRVSGAAIERDRRSSLARYHRNRNKRREGMKAYGSRRFNARRFIGWDGEGYNAYAVGNDGVCDVQHRYMLFGNSDGQRVTGLDLTTAECLDLILESEAENSDAYHVGFAFDYDVNMILGSLPWRHLAILRSVNRCRYVNPETRKRYTIEHIPHKWLRVSSGGVSATIYDAFGFFHCSYTKALKKYDVGDAGKLARIAAGKAKRGRFTYSDIEEVEAYWRDEISLFPPLMDKIRDAAYGGGYRVSEWYGPGALAAYLLRERSVKTWHSRDVPKEVKNAIRHAYAGGRFSLHQCGLYFGDIYTADLNSAYIYACSLMPRMDRGKWVRFDPGTIDSGNLPTLGLFRIAFADGSKRQDLARKRGVPAPPYPLFHRDKNGVLRWPAETDGWYWTPEAKLVLDSKHAEILEAWIFDDDGSTPFDFVNDIYNRRVDLQRKENPAEKAYKWALAAMYGAFARRVGWKDNKPPSSHELAWAGYITSWCRAAVFDPAKQCYRDGVTRGLISIDTDGVTSTVPFDESTLINGVGEGLGQWKLEHYTGILMWQNGVYWLRKEDGTWEDPKTRGLPRGTVPIESALDALKRMQFKERPFTHPIIKLQRTKFIGYRQALRGQFPKWRHWLTEPVKITMGGSPTGKAFHIAFFCEACITARTDIMHTVTPTPWRYSKESQPHRLPWLEPQPTLPDDLFAPETKSIFRDEDING